TYTEKITNIKNSFETQEYETPQDVYRTIVDELSTISYYSWTGIYLVSEYELILNYYKGAKTEHVRIPIGRGVCGSALAEGTDKIIQDVRAENNYLACSLNTRSEIVVLIKFNDHIIGQIDVDSDKVGAFNEMDQHYLQKITKIMIQQLRALGPM
ncbi:MAG: GAF domain-containing protein, partial [Candidatus Heimdallarchaeota archaeon]|nr:GAF domain-containing protein [Candidatus Heimdallarchaeota archaeon]